MIKRVGDVSEYQTPQVTWHCIKKLLRTVCRMTWVPIVLWLALWGFSFISWQVASICVFATLIGGILVGVPHCRGLTILTMYINQLSEDNKPKEINPKDFRHEKELLSSINTLQHYWRNKRTQLETMLAESKIIFDTIPDMFIMLNRNLEIVRTNSAVLQVFRKNLKWKHCSMISEDQPFLDAVNSVLEHETSRSLEIRLPSPIARDYLVRIERFPVMSPGGIAIILVLQDITESKRMKQLISDFVANASHEIRTPLTGIIGLIETLRTTAKDDPQARETFLEIMQEQSKRMNDLVNELLSLSKIEMNATSILEDEIEVGEILKEAIEQVVPLAQEKEMAIEQDMESELPAIIGDSNELHMVFNNLLSNAIKYGSQNTVIYINAGIVNELPDAVKERMGNDVSKAVYVSVKDEGEGIAEEHMMRLTERFYRVDKARSRAIGGFGLGLSIVEHILDHHKGGMHVQSVVGEGSTFTVYFPLVG